MAKRALVNRNPSRGQRFRLFPPTEASSGPSALCARCSADGLR
jgi:hypothetical protein